MLQPTVTGADWAVEATRAGEAGAPLSRLWQMESTVPGQAERQPRKPGRARPDVSMAPRFQVVARGRGSARRWPLKIVGVVERGFRITVDPAALPWANFLL